jgi:hypothetical protein
MLETEGAAPDRQARLREAGRDIAEVSRLDPGNPSLPVLRGILRDLWGTEAR